MKSGIIIPCSNKAECLNKEAIIEFVITHDQFHLCFVNCGCSDETLHTLTKLDRSTIDNVSIINVKRNADMLSALKAGSRYLHSRRDITFIGFVEPCKLGDFSDFESNIQTLEDDDDMDRKYGTGGKIRLRKEKYPFTDLSLGFLQFVRSFISKRISEKALYSGTLISE